MLLLPTLATALPRMDAASAERSVHALFEAAQRSNCGIVVERQELHEHDRCDAAAWVNPKVGIINARPTRGARTAKARIAIVWLRNLETESKLVAAGA